MSVAAQYPVLQVPTSIDYTSKDFVSLVQSSLAYGQQAFPQWNPSSEGDMGLILLELWAYQGDILSYYGDRISQEAYLATATQRLSLLNIAQLLGYIPSNGAPSSGTVTFQTANPGVSVTVPQGTQLQAQFSTTADEPPIFETTADILVPGNGGSASVEVIQGITYAMVLLGQSDGTPGQDFQIPQPQVIDGTVQVFVQASTGNTQWTYFPFLADADSSDLGFTLLTDQNVATHVIFGDNINGVIPTLGMNIWATYRVGIGAAGNIPAGSVSSFVSPVSGVGIALLGDDVTPNTTAMTGGSDPESNDQIRMNAPMAYRSQYRAVSTQDFSDLALNVPGVLMAGAVANHSTSVTLYVLGPNYTAPGPALQDSILSYFSDKTLAGVTLSVVGPNIPLVDVGSSTAPVQLVVKDNYAQAVVEMNVMAALQALLSPPNVSFGQYLTLGNIYTTILGVAGVAYAVVPLFTREDSVKADTNPIQFLPSEVPAIGQVYVTPSGGLTI